MNAFGCSGSKKNNQDFSHVKIIHFIYIALFKNLKDAENDLICNV